MRDVDSCYYFYMFAIEDKDLCLVDYHVLETSEDDAMIPMQSLCFRNPIVEKRVLFISTTNS